MLKTLRSSANQRLIVRLVRESFREHALYYAIAVGAMLIVAAMTGISAWIMRDVTNEFVGTRDIGTIHNIAFIVAAVFIAKGLATYIQSFFLSRAGNAIIADRQRKIYDRILQHGVEFFNTYTSADLITRMTLNAQSARAVIDILATSLVRDLFSLVGLVVVMVVQQPVMSLGALVFGPIAIFAVNRLLKRARKMMAMEIKSVSQIIQVVQETIFGVRVVKSYSLEEQMRKQMHQAVNDVMKRANTIAALEAATSPIMETLAGIAISGTILVAGYLVVQQGHSPGEIMSFITALLLAYEPAKRLARTRVSLEGGLVGVRMMYELTDRPLKLIELPDAKPLTAGLGAIDLKGVTFSYRDAEPVLKDINLHFAPGKMTALVGASGGGKSTLMNLLMRLYDPDSGGILFDGQDIKHATLRSLRDRIAYVSQDTFLFDDTVMGNLRMGRLTASDEEVIEAAKAANAHAFIMAMPKGYDTKIGENGIFLSGGQKQRLSIARAMLRDAQVLLLDEATSALDAESESLFRDALEHLKVGRTTVVIAHRLSTVHQADTIVVMEGGRVVEQGTHAELLKRKTGSYRKLYDFQLIPDSRVAAE